VRAVLTIIEDDFLYLPPLQPRILSMLAYIAPQAHPVSLGVEIAGSPLPVLRWPGAQPALGNDVFVQYRASL
jgi:hypothetical protein